MGLKPENEVRALAAKIVDKKQVKNLLGKVNWEDAIGKEDVNDAFSSLLVLCLR